MAASGVFDTSEKEVEVVFLMFIHCICVIETNKRTKKYRLALLH